MKLKRTMSKHQSLKNRRLVYVGIFGSVVIGIILVNYGWTRGTSALTVQTDSSIVGGVTESAAKIFVRTGSTASVAVEFSTDASLTFSTVTASAGTVLANDYTTIIALNSLQPETTYYYRVLVDGVSQQQNPLPSFMTFPPSGAVRDFTFAVISDLINIRSNPSIPAPAYQAVATGNPKFVLQIGDFDHRNPGTLGGMRKMHRQVRGGDVTTASGQDFRTYIAPRFPLFHVWDDHDYGINDGDKTFTEKASALRAFKEYYPVPPLANAVAGIWHQFRYGQADFFMLDLRSNRDPNSLSDGPQKSILAGDSIPNDQKTWLKDGLRTSTARWKFIISSVPFNPTSKPSDSWGAFRTEHDEIVNFIRANNITGVVVLSGDLHSGGNIDNGTNAGLPEMNVPHTNSPTGDTGARGTWSEGVILGKGNPGYGVIRVLTNPDRVILEAHGAGGDLRKALELR